MKILNSYKKIAKEFIKEAAWDRKFGEPLPTLLSVMKEADDDESLKGKMFNDPESGEEMSVIGGLRSTNPKTKQAAEKEKDKIQSDDSGDKPKGKALGGSDFERDFDDKGDEPKAEPSSKEPEQLSPDEKEKKKDDLRKQARMFYNPQDPDNDFYMNDLENQIRALDGLPPKSLEPKDEPKDEPDSREKRLAKAKALSKKPVTDKDFDNLNNAKRELNNFKRNKEVGRQSPKMRAKEEDLQSKVWDAENRIEDRRDAVINGEVEATPEEAEATVADLKYKVKNRETWWDKGDNETSTTKWKKMKKDLKAYQKKVKHMKKGLFGDKYESISINGQKYKAIKESKEPTKPTIHPFKKMYKRIGGK